MESYGLYEDLSLFNGDLLVGLPLLAVEEPTDLKEQDGLELLGFPSVIEASQVKKPQKSSVAKKVLSHPQHGSGEMGLADLLASSPSKDLPDPFGESKWMDTKIDILDLLTGEDSASGVIKMDSSIAANVLSLEKLIMPTAEMMVPQPVQSGPQSPEAAVVPQLIAPIPKYYCNQEIAAVKEQPVFNIQEILHASEPIVQSQITMETMLITTATELQPSVQDIEQPRGADPDDLLLDLNTSGLEELLSSTTEIEASIVDAAPILSPVSQDDIDSVLFSIPSSPTPLDNFLDNFNVSFTATEHALQVMSPAEISCASPAASSVADLSFSPSEETYFSDDSVYLENNLEKVISGRGRKSGARKAPYSRKNQKGDVIERKERKKEQNRNAALRYREKKKNQHGTTQDEADELGKRNKELKEKVESMTREIQYLKNLMADVYKAKKRLVTPKPSSDIKRRK